MSCEKKEGNLDVTSCTEFPELIKGQITVSDAFEITPEDAADPTKWQDLLLDDFGKRGYLWPEFFDFKDVSDKATYESTKLGEAAVFDGKYKFDISILKGLCLHKKMFTHRSQNSGRVILIDSQNKFFMTEKANGNYTGFKKALLHTEKLKFNDGSVATKSPLHLVLADNLEIDKSGILLDTSAFYNSLVPLTDVVLSLVGAVAAAVVTVKVLASCDQTPVLGLVAADFKITKDSDGTVEAIETVADNGDGTYTVTPVDDIVDSHINLVKPADLSLVGFESTGALALNVP